MQKMPGVKLDSGMLITTNNKDVLKVWKALEVAAHAIPGVEMHAVTTHMRNTVYLTHLLISRKISLKELLRLLD